MRCLSFFVLTLSIPLFSAAESLKGKIIEINGTKDQAKIIRNQKILQAKEKDPLLLNDIAKTGDHSVIKLTLKTLDDNDIDLYVFENSEFQVEQKMLSPKKRTTLVNLSKGFLSVVAKKLPKNEDVRIKTPNAVVGVRGSFISLLVYDKKIKKTQKTEIKPKLIASNSKNWYVVQGQTSEEEKEECEKPNLTKEQQEKCRKRKEKSGAKEVEKEMDDEEDDEEETTEIDDGDSGEEDAYGEEGGEEDDDESQETAETDEGVTILGSGGDKVIASLSDAEEPTFTKEIPIPDGIMGDIEKPLRLKEIAPAPSEVIDLGFADSSGKALTASSVIGGKVPLESTLAAEAAQEGTKDTAQTTQTNTNTSFFSRAEQATQGSFRCN